MKTTQRGMGFIGTISMLVAVVVVVIAGLKLVPAYIEFFTIREAVAAVAESDEAITPAEIRSAFDRRADVDDFTSISARDLDIGQRDISFAYEKRVPLFANISVVIDFSGSSARRTAQTD